MKSCFILEVTLAFRDSEMTIHLTEPLNVEKDAILGSNL
jgi:hypothetical protein